MERRLKLWICIALSIAPLAYLAIVWSSLPDIVPTHFDASGQPNDYSRKGTLWALGGFMSLLNIGVYLLITNLHRIDPKRRGEAPAASFDRLADGLALILSAINFIALYACTGHAFMATRMIFPLLGLLFAFLGNVMLNIKPNYFAGVRLPWTLSSDANWKATHRVTGISWFICGTAFTIAAVFLSPEASAVILLAMMPLLVAIPTIYSYRYYKKHPESK